MPERGGRPGDAADVRAPFVPQEPVVGHDEQGRPGLLRQRAVVAEHAVDFPEIAPRHVLVALEVLRIDARQLRRREGREDVPDRIGPLEVHDRQRGALSPDPVEREPVVETRLDEDAPEHGHRMQVGIAASFEILELGLRQPRQIRLHPGERDLLFDSRALGDHPRLFLRWRHDTLRCVFAVENREQALGHHQAAYRFGRVRRPHAQHGDIAAVVAGHLPDGFLETLVGGDRLADARRRVEPREVEDPVLQRARAGHHGRPDERRNPGLERAQDPRPALPHEPRQVGHRPVGAVAVEKLPVGGVKAHDDHAAGRGLEQPGQEEIGSRGADCRRSEQASGPPFRD